MPSLPLATALYVRVDDLLKGSPHLAPWRPRLGLEPRLGDAELVILAVMQALLGFVSEARWLRRHARAHLRYLFPYLPQQPGWNKRLRRAAELVRLVLRELATDPALWRDDVWIVDSTPVECGRFRDQAPQFGVPGLSNTVNCGAASPRSPRRTPRRWGTTGSYERCPSLRLSRSRRRFLSAPSHRRAGH